MGLLIVDYDREMAETLFKNRNFTAIIEDPRHAASYRGVDIVYYFMNEQNADGLNFVEQALPEAKIYAFSTGLLPPRHGKVIPMKIRLEGRG